MADNVLWAAEELSLSIGRQTLYDNTEFSISSGERVGLVGRNGSGKSTLFRLITGEELPGGGSITRARELRVALLPQEFRLDGFGVLRPGPNGTIAFAYEPRPVQSAADAAPGAASVPAGTQTAPMGQKPPKLPYSEPRVSPSAKMNPDPSVRGLRYGKPPKTTAAYTYVDRPPRRRRADRFIWVAAIAAAIAVAAIAFGYLREANDKEAEMQYLEQPADPQPATDTGAATPEQPITE